MQDNTENAKSWSNKLTSDFAFALYKLTSAQSLPEGHGNTTASPPVPGHSTHTPAPFPREPFRSTTAFSYFSHVPFKWLSGNNKTKPIKLQREVWPGVAFWRWLSAESCIPTFIPYPVGAREEQDTGSSALAKRPEEAQPRQTKTDGTDCHLQTQHKGGTPSFVSKKLFKLYSSVGMRILNWPRIRWC